MSKSLKNDKQGELFDTILGLYDILSNLLAERDLEIARKVLIEKKSQIDFSWQKYYELKYEDFSQVFIGGMSKALNFVPLAKDSSAEECLKSMKEVQEIISQELSEEEIRAMGIDESMTFFWLILAYVNDVMMTCVLKYDKQIHELIRDARNGSREEFMNLIELDPTIITTDYGREYLCIASFTQDEEFIKDISRLITKKKKPVYRKEKKRFWAFHLLAKLGYIDRPDSEWADFLYNHGFSECADVGLVKTNRNRYKIPKK